MRIQSLVLALAAAALALPGCSSFQVSSDYDPAVDFSQYGAYTWLPDPDPTEQPESGPVDGLLRQRIERAADDVLASKGMRRVEDQKDASLLITDHINIQQKFRVNTTQYGYGYGRWGYYGTGYSDTYVDQYEEGTLILDFIDAETKQLVWRGTAQSRLRDERTPEEREKRVREAVEAILERYPPSKKD